MEGERLAFDSSKGMWIPLALATRLMECYFGGGPRRCEETGTANLPPPVQKPEVPRVKLENPMARAVPRGYAERKAGGFSPAAQTTIPSPPS